MRQSSMRNRWSRGAASLPTALAVLLSCSVPALADEVPEECAPPPSELLSWWPGDGNAHDIVGLNHGTLINDATFAPGWVGQAFSLDGIEDYVELPDGIGNFGAGPFSVDFWMRSNAVGTAGTYLVGKSYPDAGLGWDIRLQDSAIQVVGVNGWDINLVSDASATANAWHLVAVTSTDTTVDLYIDAIWKGACPRSPISSTTAPLRIGYTLAFGGLALDGLIEEIEIFDRALSETEVSAIYVAGAAGKCKPAIFVDGFESGDTLRWSVTVP